MVYRYTYSVAKDLDTQVVNADVLILLYRDAHIVHHMRRLFQAYIKGTVNGFFKPVPRWQLYYTTSAERLKFLWFVSVGRFCARPFRHSYYSTEWKAIKFLLFSFRGRSGRSPRRQQYYTITPENMDFLALGGVKNGRKSPWNSVCLWVVFQHTDCKIKVPKLTPIHHPHNRSPNLPHTFPQPKSPDKPYHNPTSPQKFSTAQIQIEIPTLHPTVLSFSKSDNLATPTQHLICHIR